MLTPKEAHNIIKKKDSKVGKYIYDYGEFYVGGSGEDTMYKVFKDTRKIVDFPLKEYLEDTPIELINAAVRYEIAV